MSLEQVVFMARVAEQAERFDDMVEYLRQMIELKKGDLNNDDRNLLSVGFKNLISSARAALRQITAIAENQNAKYACFEPVLQDYKKSVEEDLYKKCSLIIAMIKDHGMGSAGDAKSQAFYAKMIADYYRYIAENASGDRQREVSESALQYYTKAGDVANASLEPFDPIRLGLALNFSVFYFEVMNNSQMACQLAKTALDDVSGKLEGLSAEQQKDAGGIVELLKDNLELWTQDENKVEDV